jgi:hypothetical protein
MSWIAGYTLSNYKWNWVLVVAGTAGYIDVSLAHSIELELMTAVLLFTYFLLQEWSSHNSKKAQGWKTNRHQNFGSECSFPSHKKGSYGFI